MISRTKEKLKKASGDDVSCLSVKDMLQVTPSYRPTTFNRPPPYVRSMRGARFACLFVCHREGETEID